jgi:hypothetical protein
MTAPNFPPLVSDFMAFFRPGREFIYGDGFDAVQIPDIQRGLNEAGMQFNPDLWDTTTPVGSTSEAGIAYMYLAAHRMVMAIQQLSGGLSAVPRGKGPRNAVQGVPVASGVGQANVSYQAPPPRVAESAVLLDLFMTTFGQIYMAMMEPRLVGNVYTVPGHWPVSAFANGPANIDPGPPA